MKKVYKIFLWIIVGVLLFFGLVAGVSSIKEWIILNNYEGFKKEECLISGTEKEDVSTGNSYYCLKVSSEGESYKFTVPFEKYKIYSQPNTIGEKIIVYRNPNLMSMSFQSESLNVIFEPDWRSRDELEKSVKPKLWIAVLCICCSGIVFLILKRCFSANIKPEEVYK